MMYLVPIILVLLSYLLGVYFSIQGLRSVMERPLIYKNELILFMLTISFGGIPLIIGVYLAFKTSGLLFVLLLIIGRFLLLPTLFNDKIKRFMKKKGI